MASSTPEQQRAAAVERSPAADPQRQNIGGLPTGLLTVLVLAAAVVALAGLRQIADIVAPAFFALTLIIAVRPLAHWLIRHRVPAWLANLAVVLLLYVGLLGMLAVLGLSVAQLSTTLPQYADRFDELSKQGLNLLAKFKINTSDIESATKNVDYKSLLGVAKQLLAGLSAGSTQMLTLLMVLAFLAMDTANIGGRARELTEARPHLAAALADFSSRVRSYWVVSTVFGLIVSAIDYVALLMLGVPMALTWAVFAFITNYIPNIGFVIGLIPPTLLALLDSGPQTALWVIVAFSVINFVMQSVVQPKFTGDAVGLNTTITFVSLLFWTTILGALGAVLAVPMTLFLKSVFLDSDPRLRWANVFLKSSGSKEEATMPDRDHLAHEERETKRLEQIDADKGPEARRVEDVQARHEGTRARERAQRHTQD